MGGDGDVMGMRTFVAKRRKPLKLIDSICFPFLPVSGVMYFRLYNNIIAFLDKTMQYFVKYIFPNNSFEGYRTPLTCYLLLTVP